MDNGWYSEEELKKMGFKHIGKDVQLSKKASFYGASHMSFGDHVRVDDFCELVGNITIGSYVHIAAYCGLHASMGSLVMGDFSTFSSRCTVYAASDDYSGEFMTNSVVPEQYRNDEVSSIVVGRHCIVGTGTCLIPGASLADGVAVGCMSLVKSPLKEWTIYAGVPCKKIKDRSRKLLELETALLAEKSDRKGQ